ncbi:ATP-binding protein, partial [Dehalococcoidia bacterium]|nr:ATP-binding protein [Dehalococcoidia bacterium]
MHIKRILVENFGPFSGRHAFDVSVGTSAGEPKPVILFGGHNGAGKTTLLDAVRLCLHGQRAVESKSQREYLERLKERIHEGGHREALDSAKVSLEIEQVDAGVVVEYLIERWWETNPKGDLQERLLLRRDGQA